MLKLLLNAREQIQEDIRTILDGFDDDYIDACCQSVVDQFQILIDSIRPNT